MDTGKKILQTIRKNNLRPASAFLFAVKHMAIWFVWALTVFVGAFVFSAFLFRVFNAGLEHIDFIASSRFHFILSSFSLFWLLLLSISALIAYAIFRNTERGHVFPWWTALLANVLISLCIGSALFFSGFGYVGEWLVSRHKGTDVEHAYLMRWNNVAEGRIAGIVSVVDDNTLLVTSPDGAGYMVDISGLETTQPIPTSEPIRVIGTLIEGGDFYACQILPVRFRGAFSREERVFQRVDEIKVGNERITLCGDIPTTDY